MKDEAPYLEMPNDMRPEGYTQKFVKAPESMHPPKANSHGKRSPSLAEMMGTMEKR